MNSVYKHEKIKDASGRFCGRLMSYQVFRGSPQFVYKAYYSGGTAFSEISNVRIIPMETINKNLKMQFSDGFEFLQYAKDHLGWSDYNEVVE